MKQVSLRIDDHLHAWLSQKAQEQGVSLNQIIIESLCSGSDIVTTNENSRIQVKFNFTYLSDLLTLNRVSTFNSIVSIMRDCVNQNEEVIIEKRSQNQPPTLMRKFTNVQELNEWANRILNI